jgi:hypothetical protein
MNKPKAERDQTILRINSTGTVTEIKALTGFCLANINRLINYLNTVLSDPFPNLKSK